MRGCYFVQFERTQLFYESFVPSLRPGSIRRSDGPSMAGVDLRSVQELGGWKSLKIVMRYSHLAPGYLHAAIERLASLGVEEVTSK